MRKGWREFAQFAERYEAMARAKQIVHAKGLRLLNALYDIRDNAGTKKQCKQIAAHAIRHIEAMK